MSKVLIIAGVSILALGLVLGLALPGLAAPDEAPPCADDFQLRIVKGKILEVRGADQEFDIQSGDEELTIEVDGDTKYFKLGVPGRIVSLARHRLQFRLQNQIPHLDNGDIPKPLRLQWLRPFGEESEFSDIEVGDRVVVCAEEENSELLAKRVLIIKPTTYARVSGTITGISSSAITITPDGGEAVPLSYNESTVFILKGFIAVEAGQYAHAIYDSDNMLAKRVTVSLTSD
jgi:hypothetical protein